MDIDISLRPNCLGVGRAGDMGRVNMKKIIDKIKYYLYRKGKYLYWDIESFYVNITYFYYHNVSPFLDPRQKWLTKKIPNTWCDKTELIRMLNFEMLVHYVEGEECFERNRWNCTPEHSKVEQQIREIYNWIKVERPALEIQLENAYPPLTEDLLKLPINLDTQSYEQLYGEVNRLEKLIYEKDTEYLKTIIEIRNYLWT